MSITQEQINNRRKQIACTLAVTFVKKKLSYVPIHYVWFPEDKHTYYALRKGNPPADSDRPKHLRGMKLHVGDFTIYEPLRDFIQEMLDKQYAYPNFYDAMAIQEKAYERLARESNIYTLT